MCIRCNEVFDYYEEKCTKCFSQHSVINIPDTAIAQGSYIRQFKSAKELLEKTQEYKAMNGFEFLGELPSKFGVLLFGVAGSGKSTFALQFANELSKLSRHDKALFIAAEEGSHSATIQKKLKNKKIDSDNLIIDSAVSKQEICDLVIQSKSKHLFIDSITALNFKSEELSTIAKIVRGVFLMIVHCTKEAIYKGDSSFGHMVDIILRVDGGKVVSTKNRFAPINKEYKLFDVGQ